MTRGGHDKHERIRSYATSYRDGSDFESLLVRARQDIVLSLLRDLRPARVVEVGCGPDLLTARAFEERDIARRLSTWVIVEPADEFAQAAREDSRSRKQVTVVPGFLEDSVSAVARSCPEPDLVLCSSLLHEVPDPTEVMGAIKSLATARTVVHINVPNALSLHRRLARAMGLIDDERDLSERNRTLRQARVMDLHSLTGLLRDAGFSVQLSGGVFLKPFTHQQMASLPFLSDRMVDGLARLGEELPDIASEIWVNAAVESSI